MNKTIVAALIAATSTTPALALDRATERDQANRGNTVVVIGAREASTAVDDIERTPGGVEVVPAAAFSNTPVQNIKDVVEYVPGVIAQNRMGDDARLSIRGSGLSRNYGNRGILLLIDGIPLNTSDGLMDLFEIDPSAYAHVEVFKGANALRYGSNALGGAINLVTPTGGDAPHLSARVDAGSFGYIKAHASTGGASGSFDYFATVSGQRIDGYRDHSNGNAIRGNLNIGYRISPKFETRFYLYGATTNQRIPGEVSKAQALNSPRAANPVWITQDQQRNVDSIRVANKTTLRLAESTVDLGVFYNNRHVKHPIFQWLDFTVDDYGGFARLVDERSFGTMRNRLILGTNIQRGTIDTEQFVNLPGAVKGALAASMIDKSSNVSAYAENTLYVGSGLALIGGLQYLHAVRDRRDRFLTNGDQSGRKAYDLWSPRVGILWEPSAQAQLFGNISRSAEVPSYDANVITAANLRPQRATAYEIGTRGRSGNVAWDISIYRSNLRDELQCLTTGPFSACTIINAGRTVHQGIEVGIDGSVPLSPAGDRLEFTAAYTLNDFYFDGDANYGDNRLPGVPEHYVRAKLLYKHSSGAYVGPNIEWSPKSYFADNANRLNADPFALLNVKAGFNTGKDWAFYVEGRNLADKRYISTVAVSGTATANSEVFNPGIGRAVFAGVRFSR